MISDSGRGRSSQAEGQGKVETIRLSPKFLAELIVLYIPCRAEGRRPGFEGRTISVFIKFLNFLVVNFYSFRPFSLYLMDSLLNRSYSADTATSSVTLPSSLGNSSRNSSSAANNSAKRRINLNTPASHQQKR